MELIKQIDQTIFFNEKTIRIVGTYDKPWFVAKDICELLDIKDNRSALRILPDKWKGEQVLPTLGGNQNMAIINEFGLYKIIMRSNKPNAAKFQDFVCEEILPSIRNTGEYKYQKILDEKNKLEEEKDQAINKVEKQLEEMIVQKNKLEEENKIIKDEKTNLVKISDGFFNCALKLPNGSSITILMREDGMINATMLCKAGKKLLANYNQNKQTKEYLDALSSDMRIPISQLIQICKGNSYKFQQGTWVHRKVAIHLAQWLSPSFAVQVSNWLDELRLQLEEKNKILETKDNEIKTLIEETKQSQDSLNTKEEKLTNGLFNCSLKLLDNSCMTIPMREDGYVNVTLLCKAGGKDIKEWKKNKSSVDILNAYFSLGGIPPSQLLNSTRVGKTQHTFAHPDIANSNFA